MAFWSKKQIRRKQICKQSSDIKKDNTTSDNDPKRQAVTLGPNPISPVERTTLSVRVDGATLTAAGEVDLLTTEQLRAALLPLLSLPCAGAADEPGGTATCDLTDVDYICSSGLGVLVIAHRAAFAAGNRLVIRVEQDSQPHRVMAMTHLDRTLNVEAVAVQQKSENPAQMTDAAREAQAAEQEMRKSFSAMVTGGAS